MNGVIIQQKISLTFKLKLRSDTSKHSTHSCFNRNREVRSERHPYVY